MRVVVTALDPSGLRGFGALTGGFVAHPCDLEAPAAPACVVATRTARHNRGTAGVGLAAPSQNALAYGNTGDHERSHWVGPPPPRERVCTQSDEQRDGQVGAEHGLRTLALRSARIELTSDSGLGSREQGHRQCGDSRETYPDPTHI